MRDELLEILKTLPPSMAAAKLVSWALAHRKHTQRIPGLFAACLGAAVTDVAHGPDMAIWRAMGVLALFPRSTTLRRGMRAQLVELGGPLWRVSVARRGALPISPGFGFAGFTVAGDDRSRPWFHAALLEDAMLCGQRWPIASWREEVVPVLGEVPVVWAGWDEDGGLVSASRDPARVHGDQVGVPHPIELPTAWRTSLRAADHEEPFEQLARSIDLPDVESWRRLDRGGLGLTLEDKLLFGRLRRLGWRRGEIIDTSRFTELHVDWLGRGDLKVFIRYFPGIWSRGPQGEPCTLSEHGFIAGRAPPSGLDGECNHEQPSVLEGSAAEWADAFVGVRLETVDPVVRSETRRTLRRVFRIEGPFRGHPGNPDHRDVLEGDPALIYQRLCEDPQLDWNVAMAFADRMCCLVEATARELRDRWRRHGCEIAEVRWWRKSRHGLLGAWPRLSPVPPMLRGLWSLLPQLSFVPAHSELSDPWPTIEEMRPLTIFELMDPTRGRRGVELPEHLTMVRRRPDGGPCWRDPLELDLRHHLDPAILRDGAPLLLSDRTPARLVSWLRQVLLVQGGMGMYGEMPDVDPELLSALTEGLPRF